MESRMGAAIHLLVTLRDGDASKACSRKPLQTGLSLSLGNRTVNTVSISSDRA
jgi:hypothetical protein